VGKLEAILSKIQEWEAEGLISAEQAEVLKRREMEGAPGPDRRRRVRADEVLVYLGSLAIFLAGAFLVGLNWDLLGSAGRILSVLVPTVLMLAAGWWLRGRQDVRLRRGAQALWLGACLLSALTFRVILEELGLFADEDLRLLVSFLLATAVAGVAFTLLTTVTQSIAFHLCGSGALFALLMWLDGTFPPFSPWRTLVIVLVTGGLWLALSEQLRPRGQDGLVRVSRIVGALTILGGNASLVTQPYDLLWEKIALEVIGFLLSTGFIALGVKRQSQSFLYCGAAYLLFLVTYVNLEHFAESIGMPVALFIAGMLLIGLGLGTGRLSSRIAASQ
jgi:hypothetical protein